MSSLALQPKEVVVTMNDEPKGDNPSANSPENPPTPSPANLTVEQTQVAKKTTDVPAGQKEPAMEISKKEFRVFEIASLGIQVLLAFIGVGALCIYGGQLTVMRGTLAEMKRSGEQSTWQVWKAIDNLNWAARSMDLSQKEVQNGLELSDRQSRTALNETIKQSRAQLEITKQQITAFEDAQAARLSIEEFEFTLGQNSGEISFIVVNRGNSIALNTREVAREGEWKNWDDLKAQIDQLKQGMSSTANGFTVAQGEKKVRTLTVSTTGSWWYYYAFFYRDIFGREQETHYCRYRAGYGQHRHNEICPQEATDTKKQ
jgi:hypothetical protein